VTLADLVALLARLRLVPSPEGKQFTELDHALQCAFELAIARPDDAELQVAGLVHDVGHQFGGDGVHGRLGGTVVRPALGARVAGLVEAHVPAKRYLVAVDPRYALSEVSAATLADQGGAFTPAEGRAFEVSPWFADSLVLRHADDAAKVAGRVVPLLEAWIPVVEGVARRAASTGSSPR
jgi:predicted HD phosphohydrolase